MRATASRWRRALTRRLASHPESELRQEIDLYVELRTAELIAEGVSRETAERQARAAFGDTDTVLEQCLSVSALGRVTRFQEDTVGSIVRDIRFALRTLTRAPRFTAAVCLMLALGIGANSAIFSVLNAVALRPLPYPESERLFRVWTRYPERAYSEFAVSNAEYLDYAADTELFEELAAIGGTSSVLTQQGPPRRVQLGLASPSLWRVLGAQPALGRLFDDSEAHPDAERVAVLSHELWQTVFASAADVVGQTATLDGTAWTIVGVAGPGFVPVDVVADVFLPLRLDRDRITDRSGHYLTVVGRARPGVDAARILAEMEVVEARWNATYQHVHPLNVGLLRDDIVGDAARPLALLLVAVTCVLAIGCANVAGLMMARSLQRQREVAIRTAVGASRGHVLRQLLVEGAVLSLAGGALGLVLAAIGLPMLLALEPGDLPRLQEVRIDGAVVAFTIVISSLAGLASALLPALRVSSTDPGRALAGGGRTVSDAARQRVLRGLVLAEVTVALVLVAGAGLLARSFASLVQVDPGMRTARVVTARVGLPSSSYSDGAAIRLFYQQLQDALDQLSGVESVGAVRSMPLADPAYMEVFLKEGESQAADDGNSFEYQFATPGYFNTMGIALVAGRDFGPDDRHDSPRVAIINETVARTFFAGEEPVGQRIRILASRPSDVEFEIIGVARDVLQYQLDQPPTPQIFVLHEQATEFVTGMSRSVVFALRTTADPAGFLARVQETVWAIDGDLAVTQLQELDDVVWAAVARPRFVTLLLSLLAATALLLAGIGIYSVVSYGVAQRTREFGIRLALGARPQEVVRMILLQGTRPALAGTVLGVLGALVLGRTLAAFLYETSPNDPVTLIAVSALLLSVAAFAAWLPARRITRIQAVDAISVE